MPQSAPDSLLTPARPVTGGQFVPLDENGISVPEEAFIYELWVQHDADGEPISGWIEISDANTESPIRLPQSSLPGLERLVQRYFGDSETVSEIGIDVSGGDLAVALRQEWHMGLVLGVLIVGIAAVGAVVTAMRSRRQAALFRTIARHEMDSRESERARVAREIHDGPLQDVAAMARGAGADATPLRAVAAELRALAAGLRPPGLEAFGLGVALEDLAERYAEATPPLAVRTRAELKPDQRLPGEVGLALYRVVQESLTNAVVHGGARTAWVFVRSEGAAVHLDVRDDGRGLPDGVDPSDTPSLVAAGHFGLAGMRERAVAMGGTLTVSAGPGGVGVNVEMRVPATPPSHRDDR